MNIEHQLKSKLAWPVCQHNMKLKQKWYSSNEYRKKWNFYWVITWKFVFSEGTDFWLGENENMGGVKWFNGETFPGGGNEQIFGWWGYSSHPPYIYGRWLKAPCTWRSSVYITYIKWPSYFCKISALCVPKMYMVYIFASLFSACNTINLSCHEYV